MVEPYYYEDIVGSRDEVDNYFNNYDSFRNYKLEDVASLRAQIQGVIDRGNVAYEKGEPAPVEEVRMLSRELSKALGIRNFSEGVTPSSLEKILEEIEELKKQKYGGIEEEIDSLQKPLNELGEITPGYVVSTADGMTVEAMEANGYTKYILDDGTAIYMLCGDDGSWVYVDLKRNLKITMDAPAAARRATDAEILNRIAENKQKLNELKSKLYDANKSLEEAKKKYENEYAKLNEITENEGSSWVDIIGAEATKFVLEKGLEAIHEALLGVGKAVNLIGSCLNLFASQETAWAQLKELVDLEHVVASWEERCKNPNTSKELHNLYLDIFYSHQHYHKEIARLGMIDMACIGFAGVELAMIASGVGTLPGIAGLVVTLSGLASSLYASYVVEKKIKKDVPSFHNRFNSLKNKCHDEEDCKTKGNCPKCVSEGSCPKWPKGPKEPKHPSTKPVLDPSGFVFEGVESNRLEGVTATVLLKQTTKDIFGDDVEKVYVWDAENYDQVNPQQTDENGEYGWMVPAGLWQVKYEKQGYQTEFSDWLPVPPPQLDVNQAMTSQVPPVVSQVKATPQQVLVTF